MLLQNVKQKNAANDKFNDEMANKSDQPTYISGKFNTALDFKRKEKI